MYDSSFWDSLYEKYLTNSIELPWCQNDFVEKSKNIIKDIIPDPIVPQMLLDYGSGIGTYIDLFVNKLYEITAIDISQLAINACKNQYGNKIFKYLTQDSPSNINGKFDVIFCWGVIHHITQNKWNSFIKEFHSLLKPSGIFIISGWDNLNDRFVNQNGISNNTHAQTWSINDIQRVLDDYFIVEKNDTFSFDNVKRGDNNFRYYVCRQK
jgi:2-polyprenyl-3-methyl-5-hydroxy-6-metoxy-1,4-benzoquinol methylase